MIWQASDPLYNRLDKTLLLTCSISSPSLECLLDERIKVQPNAHREAMRPETGTVRMRLGVKIDGIDLIAKAP